jgi:hypothetical protein
MIRNITTLEQYNEVDFRLLFPQINLGELTSEKIAEYGYEFYEDVIEHEYIIPSQISPRQARLALLQLNMLDTVEAALSAQPKQVQLEWEYATYVERCNPLVISLCQMLGMNDEEIDQLFILGSQL